MYFLTLILFWILYSLNAEKLIKICFKNPEGLFPDFTITFAGDVQFIPDVIKFTAILKENTYDSEIGVLRTVSYTLWKTIHRCQEDFAYDVPYSSHPIMTLELKFTWGLQEFLIDSLLAILKPDFSTSVHTLGGARNLIWVKLCLRHEINPQKTRQNPQNHIQPVYTKKVRSLYSKEFYCMTVLTDEFSETLIFSKPPIIHGKTSEYYILTISVFSKFLTDEFVVKKYRTKIFPCRIPDDFDQKLKIFIDPATPGIRFELSDGENVFLHIIESFRSHRVRDFVFGNIDIEVKKVTQDMVDGRVGLLLYRYRLGGRKCQVRIPENMDDLDLSFVLDRKNQDVLLKRMFLSVEMETKELGIYIRRHGTTEEFEKCMKE